MIVTRRKAGRVLYLGAVFSMAAIGAALGVLAVLAAVTREDLTDLSSPGNSLTVILDMPGTERK